jgi:phage host-nuclease inhibitor protein Gam
VLKEEINLLKVELNDNEAKMSDDNAKRLSKKIGQMERQLERLKVDMDDKIQFAQTWIQRRQGYSTITS